MNNISIVPRNIEKNDNDEFVGIKLVGENDKGKVDVTFPLGYHLDDKQQVDDDQQNAQLQKQSFHLLSLIQRYNKSDNLYPVQAVGGSQANFPFDAYITVIRLFLANGYYIESEIKQHVDTKGKINWKKTIKNVQPIFQGNEVIFTKFVVKNNTKKDDNLISLIHEWCVREAFEKLGWLFTFATPRKARIDCEKNKSYYVAILQQKLSQTFNDKYKELFSACLAMLKAEHSAKRNEEFYLGTTHFYSVWETLIDCAFGIDSVEKKKYFPPAGWEFVGKLNGFTHSNSLQPDTIMEYGDDLFVLDAKYYSFMLNPLNLPAASDINKQVRYGSYANDIREKECPNNKTYNAFMIPYDFEANIHELDISKFPFFYIGFACLYNDTLCKRPDIDKSYKKVLGILVDTKWLMENYKSCGQEDLAKFIKSVSKIPSLSRLRSGGYRKVAANSSIKKCRKLIQ